MRIVSLFISLFFLFSFNWGTNLDNAKVEASETKKHVLVSFSGSDWCVPCKKMEKNIFHNETFIAFAKENLILVNLDFPSKQDKLSKEQIKHNETNADKYNPKGIFPYTILMSADGKVLKKWMGYKGMKPEEFIESIKENI